MTLRLRTAIAGLAGAVALVLLFVALNLQNPLLVERRPLAAVIVAVLGVAGSLIAWRQNRILFALWLAVPVATVLTVTAAHRHVTSVLSGDAREQRELGRHFIVGYTHLEEIETLSERGLIGGVFITRRNAAGRSIEALREEIRSLQQRRAAAGLPPLIVATDQEGGPVSRLSPPLGLLPTLASLTQLPADQQTRAARDAGKRQGEELASVGITLDFAPVVDLRLPRPDNPLDFNTHLSERAISGNPHQVAAIAQAYAEGMDAAGVTPTLKHFPGLGRVPTDTHVFSARLETSSAVLDAADWIPFRQILAQTQAALMVGHVTLASVDAERPASRSKAVVEGLIRKAWGFNGIVVTDDMTMGAIFFHGYCQAMEDALNAGVDLLLISWDGAQFYPAMDCARTSLRDGRLDRDALRRSDARLAAFLRGTTAK
jgi:beta-N-acetylhexosaminidase